MAIANAHTINIAHKTHEFGTMLNAFSIVLNDGAGLELYGRILGSPFHYNFNGTDLFPRIFRHWNETSKKRTLFLYGAKPGVAETAKRNIEKHHPNIRVVGCIDGYTGHTDATIIEEINLHRADLLLVALGNPRQEEWIHQHQLSLKVQAVCGVGALFDFLSESIPRAPLWMRRMRIEWLFRLVLEPKRMASRYIIGNPLFILRTVKFMFLRKKI